MLIKTQHLLGFLYLILAKSVKASCRRHAQKIRQNFYLQRAQNEPHWLKVQLNGNDMSATKMLGSEGREFGLSDASPSENASLDTVSFAQRQRLAYIDFCLLFKGAIYRQDLIGRFEVGLSAGSRDFSL